MTLVLVDSHNLVHRNFHVGKDLMTSEGLRVGGAFGFVKSMRRLVKEYEGSQIVLVWDSRSKRRKSLSVDYKANRRSPETCEEAQTIAMNLELARKASKLFGFLEVWVVGVEADDIIAMLARRTSGQAVIYSTDKDFYQLLSKHHIVIDRNEDKGLLTSDNFEDRKGLTPLQYRLHHAISGDPSDNVPKIPGVGWGTVNPLVKEIPDSDLVKLYEPQWWDWFHNYLGSIPGARVAKIRSNLDQVRSNFALIDLLHSEIVTEEQMVDAYAELDRSSERRFDLEGLYEMFQRYEFHSMDFEYLLWFQRAMTSIQTWW